MSPTRNMLPHAGSVLGIDIGFSTTRRSSAVCRLSWDQQTICWSVQRFRAIPDEQVATIAAVAGNELLLAAAFDGPLRAGFEVIGRYRTAERMLTRRLGRLIGKPGQSSTPVGKQLNAAANACVKFASRRCLISPAVHLVSIDRMAVVEAFPSSFLGVALDDPSAVTAVRADRSDTFFKYLTTNGTLRSLLEYFLPGRALSLQIDSLTNHDDRAAFVCALTALAVAGGDFTAVGDADGWIILPPRHFVQPWAWTQLEANDREEVATALHVTSRAFQPQQLG